MDNGDESSGKGAHAAVQVSVASGSGIAAGATAVKFLEGELLCPLNREVRYSYSREERVQEQHVTQLFELSVGMITLTYGNNVGATSLFSTEQIETD